MWNALFLLFLVQLAFYFIFTFLFGFISFVGVLAWLELPTTERSAKVCSAYARHGTVDIWIQTGRMVKLCITDSDPVWSVRGFFLPRHVTHTYTKYIVLRSEDPDTKPVQNGVLISIQSGNLDGAGLVSSRIRYDPTIERRLLCWQEKYD